MKKIVDYKVYDEALRNLKIEAQKISHSFGFENKVFEFYDKSIGSEDVNIGVNWCSLGTVTTQAARNFANLIIAISVLADNFCYNGYTINW